MNRFPAGVYRILRSPLAGTSITLLIIVAGCLGSIFSPEVRSAFPFSRGWSWQASSFWSTAIIASLAYFLRETAMAAEQRELQHQTLLQAKEFEKLIRTQPPKNFLAILSSFFETGDAIVTALLGSSSATEELQGGARHLLRMIAVLAQRFDGDDLDSEPSVSYSANIMLAQSPADLSPEECENLSGLLKFCDDSVAIEKLRAVLTLVPELSTTARDNDATPDPDATAFSLAVPAHARSGSRYKVLPGAPIAFVERRPDVYEDTADLVEWCNELGDFTKETVAKVEEYFRTSEVKGFLSIPLFRLEAGTESSTRVPFAILNVHCTKSGMLGRGEALPHFYNLIYPLQLLLIKLLLALDTTPPGLGGLLKPVQTGSN